jgi:dTDP-glucose pyrophosphorylase
MDSGLLDNQQHWRRAVLLAGATVSEAIRNLNEVGIKIVLVSDRVGSLVGTITDGDIRRGLMRGVSMEDSVQCILNQKPLIVSPCMSQEQVKQLMWVNKVQQIPIVDAERQIVGLHLWDEVAAPNKRHNLMVIMAGGMGKRLYPHTKNCPKPLLQVGDRPVLEHIIIRAKSEGFTNFVLSIGYLGHMIEDYFKDGSKLDIRIEYVRESTPLGTAGALSLLNPIPAAPFIVTNGDVITNIRYAELLDFHVTHSADATMAVRLHEWQNPFGVVETDGINIIRFDEKPVIRSHINAGIYTLNPSALNNLIINEYCDMPNLFERLHASQKKTIAYPMHETWIDIGRPDDLALANMTI